MIKKYKNLGVNEEKYSNDEDMFKLLLIDGYNYPEYLGHKKYKNILLYIRNYLILKKNNVRKNRYPDYIYQTEGNVEIQKKYFRNIAANYSSDNNNNLYLNN